MSSSSPEVPNQQLAPPPPPPQTENQSSSVKKKKTSSSTKNSGGETNNNNNSNSRKAFLAGDYAVYTEEEIGRGSFSKVFPATLLSNPAPRGKEEFAAKYCELKDSISRDRFDEEANNVVKIHDKFQVPYVIKLIKRFLTKSSANNNNNESSSSSNSSSSSSSKGILIYEMCRGPSLHTILLRNGPLPPHLVQRFLAHMVEALACCHARGCEVVHRDVKPENFLLSSHDVESAIAVLIDFGFSIRGEGREPCGTPMFMSPEVLSGNLHGPPTDIFSLGVTALTMIFGLQPSEHYGVLLRLPHPPISINPHFVRESIDESSPHFRFRDIVAACVDPDPKKRPTAMQLRSHELIRSAGIVTAKKIGSHHSHSHSHSLQQHTLMSNNNNNNTNAEIASTSIDNSSKIAAESNEENNSKKPTEEIKNNNKSEKTNNDVVAEDTSNTTTTTTTTTSMLLPQVEQTTADRVKNSSILQLDGFTDRVQALLTIANTLQLPARRASICVKVARILCHEVNAKHLQQQHQQQQTTSSSPKLTSPNDDTKNTNSFANTTFLMNNNNNSSLRQQNDKNNNSSLFFTNMGREGNIPLLEQLQWVKSQLASLMNVLPDDEPLPDCDVAIADGVKNLAGAALRAMLLGESECCYGECVSVIRFCRIALKKDLVHYSELNPLRKKLDAFALVA